MEVSIIIPTYNRADILSECLQRISENNFPKSKYEVLIIDDASRDHTQKVAEKFSETLNVTYHRQKKAGQGVARNYGIEHANGEILIFIGDDIFVCKTFINEHYQFHKKHSEVNHACLGLILWDPAINISPLMRWSTHELTFLGKFGGHQFAFEKLKNEQILNHKYFYTSNISIKKNLLEKEKFDPWFDGYGWEDIELAYRLEKKHKLKTHYSNNAVAYHHHEISFENFKERMKAIGAASRRFEKKHPEINVLPTGTKKIIFSVISSWPSLKILEIAQKISEEKFVSLYYYALSKKFLLDGIKNELK